MATPKVADESAPVIEARGVTKNFGKLCAVDNLELTIRAGEFVALLGPNGAGKTTLVEMIEGIQAPDTGDIRILGMNWREHERALRFSIGVALQETRFYDRLTAREILDLFASFYERPRSRSAEILEMTRLGDKGDARVAGLSGGQKQRLALGIALLNDPRVLLLDEPTTGLDPNARREVWGILEDLRQRNVTMILTTHYMEEAEHLCDRILIMDRGRILAKGSLEALLRSHGGGEIIEFSANGLDGTERYAGVPGLISAVAERGKIRLVVEDLRASLPAVWAIQGDAAAADLVCRRMNLDDLFTKMTGRALNENAD